MANLKAALIGCGGMGRGHAQAGQQLGVEVVAFCDVIESAAERGAGGAWRPLRHHRRRPDHA